MCVWSNRFISLQGLKILRDMYVDDSQLAPDSVEARYQKEADETSREPGRSPAQMLCKCCAADTTGAAAKTFEKRRREYKKLPPTLTSHLSSLSSREVENVIRWEQMGGEGKVDVPPVTAEPEHMVEQPGTEGPVGDEATPDPNRADEEPATVEPENGQTLRRQAGSDLMSSELINIHFPFDQKLFTNEGRFFWKSGDLELP